MKIIKFFFINFALFLLLTTQNQASTPIQKNYLPLLQIVSEKSLPQDIKVVINQQGTFITNTSENNYTVKRIDKEESFSNIFVKQIYAQITNILPFPTSYNRTFVLEPKVTYALNREDIFFPQPYSIYPWQLFSINKNTFLLSQPNKLDTYFTVTTVSIIKELFFLVVIKQNILIFSIISCLVIFQIYYLKRIIKKNKRDVTSIRK